MRCLWLFRHKDFPVAEELPAVQVIAEADDYATSLSASKMPVQAFLDAAFGGRFRFGLPSNGRAVAQIRVGEVSCWKRNCAVRTKIVTGIDVLFGSNTYSWAVRSIGEAPGILRPLLDHLPPDPYLGKLKKRYSKTLEQEYMSNGCYRCDSLMGQHYEHEAYYTDEIVSSFPISISGDWRRMIEKQYEPRWAVYATSELSE